MVNELVYFAFGIVCGIVPCLLWGMIGGDDCIKDPFWKPYLNFIHHWQIGLLIMGIGVFTHPFVLGWGVGTAVDDMLFHSFEMYFCRKEIEKD